MDNETIGLVKQNNAFDFLRFFLAVAVLLSHFSVLTGSNTQFWTSFGNYRVKGFFVISGFLILFSFLRSDNITTYAKKRLRRIFPAYIVAVMLCAILCMFVSIYDFEDYYLSSDFCKYLVANLSTLNFLHPTLPGVFISNPIQAVNGSLWTIKVELALYISVPFICYFMSKWNKKIVLLSVYIISVVSYQIFTLFGNKFGGDIYFLLRKQFVGQMSYFYSAGAILIFFRHFYKYRLWILPFSLIICLLKDISYFYFLEPIAFSSLIIGSVYSLRFLNGFKKLGNISYGIFLVHFPIVQLLVYFRVHEYNYWGALLLCFVCSIFLAILSWNYIEKPFIQGRKLFILQIPHYIRTQIASKYCRHIRNRTNS